MDRLQFAVERVRVWRRQGSADNTDKALEAGRAHVQQVSQFVCPIRRQSLIVSLNIYLQIWDRV